VKYSRKLLFFGNEKEIPMSKNKTTKTARFLASKYLSEKNGYSHKVARSIIDCMGTTQRTKFLDRFREDAHKINKERT